MSGIRDPCKKYERPMLGGGSTGDGKSRNKGHFVKGGVQVSNLANQKDAVHYDEVKDSHFKNIDEDSPKTKKTKLEEVHDDEYQKKLFTAAQSYTSKKHKQDLMDNIHKWNWKVRKGEKTATIKANDIKGYLYIWCNQRRVTPEWDYTEKGKVKKIFTCHLTIPGLEHIGVGEGPTKKEAQSNASWDMCNYCAGVGFMNADTFPRKEKVDTNSAGCIPSDWKTILKEEHIKDAGGWNPENCQKRLQTFCSMEKVSCEIVNSCMGPDHAKIQISELKITLRKYGKEFYAKEQARTKKCGNSLVCWSIVKQLYKAKMIEKFGDRVRKPAEIKAGTGKSSKVQETVDEETGDWTLDTARQKLHEYLARRQLTLEYEMSEHGPASTRTYVAELNFELDGKRYKGKDSALNKKSAQKKVALDIVIRLYKEGKISANVMIPGVYHDPRRPFISGLDPEPIKQSIDLDKMNQREKDEKCCTMKLDAIMPETNMINAVNHFMDHIEKSLKEISDKFLAEEKAKDENKEVKDDNAIRQLAGIMRIGTLASSLNLKGENGFLAVVMMLEKPTFSDVNKLAKALQENMKENYHENYVVEPDTTIGGVEVTRNAVPKVTIMLQLSSAKCRPGPDGEVVADPTKDRLDTIPSEICIKSLADLRRAKWYNMNVAAFRSKNDVCLNISRLIRDMCLRINTWNVFSDWNIQLLVQKSLESNTRGTISTLSDGLWRFFSVIAGGILLPGSEGILDPCEREGIDSCRELTEQDREDLTTSAQHALRLISFGQIHKILGMPPLPDAIKEAENKAKLIAMGKA